MSIRPAASQAGNAQAFRLARIAVLLSAPLALVFANPALADGKEVLAKSLALYKGAKAYQGTMVIKQTGPGKNGKPVTISRTERIQYKSPNFFHIEVTSTAIGLDAKQTQELAGSNLSIISDGKTTTVYSPAQNKFKKQPTPPAVPLIAVSQALASFQKIDVNKVVQLPNPATVQGKQGVQIQLVLPPLPPKADETMKKNYATFMKTLKVTPKFVIDKQNNYVLSFSQDISNVSLGIELTSQVFSPAFTASAFNFSPPKGATEAKQPPAGAPGAPGQMNLGGKQ